MTTFVLIDGGGDVGWAWHPVEKELRRQGPDVVAPDLPCDDDAAGLPEWPDVPTRFVLCTEDRFFPADLMRPIVADRLAIVPDEIAAGHCVALSRPQELADILVGYVTPSNAPTGTPTEEV